MQKVETDKQDDSQEPFKADPKQLDSYAHACSDYVQRALGVAPDFTVDTLPLLDHYLSQVRSNAAHRPEASDMIAIVAGAYLGMLVVDRHDGIWITEHDDPIGWNVSLLGGKLLVYPFVISFLALHPDEADEAPAPFIVDKSHTEAISEYLANLPSVSEDEYIAPSTRIEVIDIIVDQLIGRRSEQRR